MTFDQFMRLLEVLKWPVVFLALALVVILLFRTQLATFFSRITSIGKEGLKIGPATGQQSQPDRTNQAQELMRALDSSALLEQERLIKADLEKRGLEHTGETIDFSFVILLDISSQSHLRRSTGSYSAAKSIS